MILRFSVSLAPPMASVIGSLESEPLGITIAIVVDQVHPAF